MIAQLDLFPNTSNQSIIKGDCLTVMQSMDPNSIDFIVTDPPYGLHFMGKKWDAEIPRKDIWAEALRVCKPGSMLAAFGGSRTHHHLMLALEQAGWEIRDVVMWLYGSGFPKSLDISKSIDKRRIDDFRHVCRFLRKYIEDSGKTTKELASIFGCNVRLIEHWAARDTDSQPYMPNLEEWNKLKSILSIPSDMDDEVLKFNQRKNNWSDEAKTRILPDNQNHGWFCGNQMDDNSLKEEAKLFSGYGTALKPAYEPIILAMKPLEGTYAQNAEKWGVAGINIDESRIESEDFICNQSNSENFIKSENYFKGYPKRESKFHSHKKGRWPSNIILDEVAGEMLDEQSGNLKSTGGQGNYGNKLYGDLNNKPLKKDVGFHDSGGASRFFYCAKTSSAERSEGNNHPTVKPIALMKYIIKLLAPPGSPTLLDPFAGSGSTLIAAKKLDINAIGIEMSEEYCNIAKKRLEA